MALTDQTAVLRPPTYHVHQHDKATDTVEELNEWAVGLFSPTYSEQTPAFTVDDFGDLHAFVNTVYVPVPDGFWIVFNPAGGISVLADTDFQGRYELA